MNSVFTAAFAAVVLIASGISAGAATLDVTWIAAFNNVASPIATWHQDTSPTPIGFATGEATVVPISDFVAYNFGAYAPVGTVDLITYYNSAVIPSTTLSTVPFGGIVFSGPQAYTGSEAAPQFAPGAIYGLFEGDANVPSLLIFSVPEPSTWALMLAGFASLGVWSFRMRRQGAVLG